jgi:hypothetical protein
MVAQTADLHVQLAKRIRRITFLSRLIGATTVLWILGQIVVTVASFELSTSWVAAYRASAETDPILGGYKMWALPEVGAMILAWIVSVAWLWQVRSNAELVEPDSQELSRSVLVFSWVTPVFMMWTPYEVFSDAARPTVRVAKGREAAAELPLRLWWASYLLALLVTMLPHGYPVGQAENLPTIRLLSVAAIGVTILSAVIWLRVVKRVTAAQADLRLLAEAVEVVRQADGARR